MNESMHRHDDYLKCSAYASNNPDGSGFHRFEEGGKFYFSFIEHARVILRSEGYSSESSRENGIASVQKNMGSEDQYVTKQLPDGRWVLSLKAGNNQEIARSCPFGTEDEVKAFLPSARAKYTDEMHRLASVEAGTVAQKGLAFAGNASDGDDDDYMICREYEEKYNLAHVDADGFISFQHENTGKYYFAWYGKDGRVKLRSEGYPNAGARDNGLASVKKNKDLDERWSTDSKHGVHFLILKAGNHQEIGRSCPFKSEDEAWGIIRNAPVAAAAVATAAAAVSAPVVNKEKDDDYLHCDAYKGHDVSDKVNNIAYFKGKDGQLYFVVYNRDGSVKLRSEGFDTVERRDSELKEVIRLLNDDSMYHTIEKAGYRMRVLKDKSGREIGRSCPEKIGAAVTAAAAAAPVVTTAREEKVVPPPVAPVATGGGFNWWWLLPLLLLIPLFFMWRSCSAPKADMSVTTPAVETTTTAPVATDTISAKTEITKTEPVTAAKTPDCDLNWILFDFDKYDIRSDANAELQQMAKILKENPSYVGVLKAHTDSRGSDEYNQALSQNRAREAKKVLVAAGIEEGRLQTTASSEADPIATNTDDDSGRRFNRRVELYVRDASGKEICKSIPPQVPDNLKGR